MRLRLIALFLVIGLCAAACTGGSGGPSDSPSPTSAVVTSIHSTPTTPAPVSSSPTVPTTGPNVRPGEKPPTPIAITRTNTPAGAVNFGAYWIQTLDWGYATTDSTLAKSAYEPSCRGCAKFVRFDFDTVRRNHQHYVGGRLSILRASVAPDDGRHGSTAATDVTVDQSALKIINTRDRVIERTPASAHVTFRTWLSWNGSHWRVVDWKRLAAK